MIRSGSHVPGVSAAAFGLPPGTALRFELPSEPLRDFLPTYGVLDSCLPPEERRINWMLPGWASIWVVLTEGPIRVAVGGRRYDPIGSFNLYGVTSRAMPVTAEGGVTVLADVSPLGWARFFGAPAEQLRDRITPLDRLMPADRVTALRDRLAASDRDLAVKGLLDQFFAENLPPEGPDEPLVRRIAALLADPGTRDLASAARDAGIGGRALLAASKRYFGFPPKILLMRARFLRAITAMLVSPEPVDFGVVPPGYHDASHFLRDANRFLGTTPRRFLAHDHGYLRASLRARRLVAEGPAVADAA